MLKSFQSNSWVCQNCGRCNAPWMPYCCKLEVVTITTPGTSDKDIKDAINIWKESKDTQGIF